MITPLKNTGSLDPEGLEKLIEHILSGGVHGLFILGTTGEAQNLSQKLRYELVERVCTHVDRRVPVLVGITDTSAAECIRLAENAAECGAEAVVAAPPYYYRPNQQELENHFMSLADKSPLPLFLYNMPSHVKVHFQPETVIRLAEHSNITGLKDSSADLIYFQKIARQLKGRQEFTLLMGPEELLMQSLLAGGHGGVNGGANMFPGLYVDMYNAVIDRDVERMNTLQEQIIQISSTIYTVGPSGMRYIQGVKCVLAHLGICSDELAEPFQKLEGRDIETVKRYLTNLNFE